MAKTTTVTLSAPLEGHGAMISQVMLREPTLRDRLTIGSAYVISDGAVYWVDEAIQRYLRACLVEPKDPLLIDRACLEDAEAIIGAVQDFFVAALMTRLKVSPSNSPDGDGLPSPTSGT
jgi:hypothetical protein